MIKFDELLLGKATFTVSNSNNEHYTYKISKKFSNGRKMFFIALLTGADNTNNYTYMGMINELKHVAYPTRASKLNLQSKAFKVLNWAFGVLDGNKTMPDGYSILPAGKCFKCGRKLTTPESIKSGLGPHCRKMVG